MNTEKNVDHSHGSFRQGIFSADIDRPFVAGWRALAFERNKYNNTRMPQWVFDRLSVASKNRGGPEVCLFCGSVLKSGVSGKKPFSCQEIGFSWTSYSNFLLDSKNYSPEFFVFDETKRWGIWADMEVTVVGGVPEIIDEVIAEIGGEEKALQFMLEEFGLGEEYKDSEFVNWLERLLAPTGKAGA